MTAIRKTRTYVGLALRIAISGGILLYLFGRLNIANLAAIFTSADPVLLVVAVLALGITFLLSSARWWLLLKVQSINVSMPIAARMTFIGLYFNNFLLGGFGGDVARAFYIMKSQPHKRIDAGFSIVADRLMGMLVLLAIVAAAVPLKYRFLLQRPETAAVIEGMLGVLVAAVLLLGAIAFVARKRHINALASLIALVRKWDAAVTVCRSLLSHRSAGKTTGAALLVSVLVVGGTAVTGQTIANALGLEVDFTQMLVILAVVICMMSLPISVAGHGVREAAFVVMFQAFDIHAQGLPVDQNHAVAFSLIYYGLHLFWGLVGGLIFITGNPQERDLPHSEIRQRDLSQ